MRNRRYFGAIKYSLLFSLLAFLVAGCSSLHNFILINSSDRNLEVTVSYPRVCENPPRVLSETDVEAGNRQWKALAESQYKHDPENLQSVVDLKPGQALLVINSINYGGHQNDDWGVSFLKIVDADKKTEWKGKEGQYHFTQVENDFILKWTTL